MSETVPMPPNTSLPEGFRYRCFGWAGEALAHGGGAPGAANGRGLLTHREQAAW